MGMLVMDITYRSTEAATPVVRRRAFREGMMEIAALWHQRYKMEKFKDGATRRYGLAPRRGEPGSGRKFKGSYSWAKLMRRTNGQGVRAIGETKPFVWSGDSRSRAKSAEAVAYKRGGGDGKGYSESIVNAPTLNLRPKNGRIHVREEFERVIEEERRALEIDGARVYLEEIEAAKPRRVRIVGFAG